MKLLKYKKTIIAVLSAAAIAATALGYEWQIVTQEQVDWFIESTTN